LGTNRQTRASGFFCRFALRVRRRACENRRALLTCHEVTRPVLAEYLPILLFLIVAGGIGVALLGIGALLGPRSANKEKSEAYECGFEAFEDARMKFDVRYYLIAILFIIFDLEIAFLFPWAVVFKHIGVVALIEMLMFLLLLLLGFVYCWKKGALEWE
jgi:NADH-quinone oxidoreductase subunit A